MIIDNKAQGTFVGFYVLDGFQKLGLMKKPNWFRRAITRVFFGWKWVDK